MSRTAGIRKYRIHFADYAVAENEKLYNAMAAEGWALKRRGLWLDSFVREKEARKVYRVELAVKGTFERKAAADDRLSLYKGKGWKLVASGGLTAVFAALPGTAAPELGPFGEKQEETKQVVKKEYIFSLLSIPLVFFIFFMLTFSGGGSGQSFLSTWITSIQRLWTEATALLLLEVCLLIGVLISRIYRCVRMGELNRRLQKDGVVERRIHRSTLRYRRGMAAVAALCLVCLAGVGVQIAGLRTYPMPQQADGPYLTLADLGWEGERVANSVNGEESQVETWRSLRARCYSTFEEMAVGDDTCWMYQYVYEFGSESAAGDYVPVLMNLSLFAGGAEGYEEVQVEGLDLAWQSDLEYIAVKGNTVYYAIYSDPGFYDEQGTIQKDYLTALAGSIDD